MSDKPEKWTVLGVPWALIARFKAQCAMSGCTLGEAVTEALAAWLKEKGKGVE